MATVQLCPRCGGTFTAYASSRRVFCSQACHLAHGGRHVKAEPIILEASRVAHCGQCGKTFIDHSQPSGTVRGILCNLCNTALGLMRDNPEHLRRAIAYLDSLPDPPPAAS